MTNRSGVNESDVDGVPAATLTVNPRGNGAINSYSINAETLNGGAIRRSVHAGVLLSIGQSVGKEISASVILRVEQAVDLQIRTDTSQVLLGVEQQTVTEVAAGTLLKVEQRVQNVILNDTYSLFQRMGYEIFAVLGGRDISTILHGNLTITIGENDSRTAQFSIVLPVNVYDLTTYQGKTVKLYVHNAAGVKQVFDGYVDVPTVNVIEEKLTFKCIADRRQLINTKLAATYHTIGYYAKAISGDIGDVYTKVANRLETIPYSIDFDGSNNYSLNAWAPKTVADYTYGSSAVYRRDPQLILESAAKVVNRVNLTVEYQYQRCHQGEVNFLWAGDPGACYFLTYGLSMCRRDMVIGAASPGGWTLKGSIGFQPILPSGNYGACGMWSTVAFEGEVVPKVESHIQSDGEGGFETVTSPIKDANGNPVMETNFTSATDYAGLYTFGAQWKVCNRFTQNIKEKYSLTVTAPTSINVYSSKAQDENYTVTAEYDSASWEKFDAFKLGPPGGYVNQDNNRGEFGNTIKAAISRAKTIILESHRDSRIVFQRQLSPELELKHTIALTGKWVRGKGKCFRIVHTVNFSTGEAATEVELAFFRSAASATDSPLTIPTAPVDAIAGFTKSITMTSHYGEDYAWLASVNQQRIDNGLPIFLRASGYYGNRWAYKPSVSLPGEVDSYRTQNPEHFVVETPEIPATHRDERILTQSASYTVNIPQDTTTEYETYG